VSIAPKNNQESPPEQTAKAFLQRTTKHQHTASPNKILKDSLRIKQNFLWNMWKNKRGLTYHMHKASQMCAYFI
jgi:hypothetical protein